MTRRCAYGGADARREDASQSHEMGMHTERCAGRTQQRFFDSTEESDGFTYPDALDVDFNKRAEIRRRARSARREINLRASAS